MKTLGQQLLEAEFSLRLNQDEAARRAGVSVSVLRRIENDDPSVGAESRELVAKAFKLSYDRASDPAARRRPGPKKKNNGEIGDNVESYSETKLAVEPPLFEMSIHASHWEQISDNESMGQFVTPAQMNQGIFRVRIRGDCMEPKYKDGEIVEFLILKSDLGMPDFEACKVGKNYYVQIDDGRATFKSLEKIEPDRLVLAPLNKKYRGKRLEAEFGLVQRLAVVKGRYYPDE